MTVNNDIVIQQLRDKLTTAKLRIAELEAGSNEAFATGQKEVERKLQESETHFRLIFEGEAI